MTLSMSEDERVWLERLGKKDFDELATAAQAVLHCMYENFTTDAEHDGIIHQTDELTEFVAELEDVISFAYANEDEDEDPSKI